MNTTLTHALLAKPPSAAKKSLNRRMQTTRVYDAIAKYAA